MTYVFPITTGYSKTTSTKLNSSVDSIPITLGFTDIEPDILSFMETFVPSDLKKVKTSLRESKYSKEQINEIVVGLKTLSEYKRG